jgi:hypothetical protein
VRLRVGGGVLRHAGLRLLGGQRGEQLRDLRLQCVCTVLLLTQLPGKALVAALRPLRLLSGSLGSRG